VKVVIICEGPTEGVSPHNRVRPAPERLASLAELVSKALRGEDVELLPSPTLRVTGGSGPILKNGCELIKRSHVNQQPDVVVMVVDNDRTPGHERLKILRQHRDTFWEERKIPTRIAVGVAIEAFEAWLLADRKALKEALGLSQQPPDEGSPEGLTGRPGSGSHPNEKLNQLIARDSRERGYVECVADIASRTRIDELTRRCPKGFEPFARELRRNLD